MAFKLDQVDVDGAVREASDRVAGDTRLAFLRKGALAGGAALSGGAILSALVPGVASAATVGAPPASFGAGDIGILNYALTLEYLESAFYDAASRHHLARGDRQLTHILDTVKRDEAAHVAKLKAALGSQAVKRPTFDFGKVVTDKHTFTETAFELENTGVHAYLGQAGNIMNPAYLLVAASIVTIEARHSGAFGVYLGKPIAPNGPFDTGYTATKVLSIVNKTHFIK
ncbi:MAG TPA: ferritin-like domain-containing protein [Solirubrobacteraceae bacterium]|nr:ferritin-like domain-containing protein [Solirubrobacteraceae bacterium]